MAGSQARNSAALVWEERPLWHTMFCHCPSIGRGSGLYQESRGLTPGDSGVQLSPRRFEPEWSRSHNSPPRDGEFWSMFPTPRWRSSRPPPGLAWRVGKNIGELENPDIE